jgi:hypothetical protein
VKADEINARLAEDGFAVIADVLSPAQAEAARARLWRAANESERRGVSARNVKLALPLAKAKTG